MTLVGTKTILGQEFEVHTDISGAWRIMRPIEGDEDGRIESIAHHEKSLEGAINAARAEIKKRDIMVEVPFKTAAGQDAVAITLDGRSGKVIATVDGKRETFERRSMAFKPDTPTEKIERYVELQEIINNANRERRTIEQAYRFNDGITSDLSAAVTRARERAAQAAA